MPDAGEHLTHSLHNACNVAAIVSCNKPAYIWGQTICHNCEFSSKLFVFVMVICDCLQCELDKGVSGRDPVTGVGGGARPGQKK